MKLLLYIIVVFCSACVQLFGGGSMSPGVPTLTSVFFDNYSGNYKVMVELTPPTTRADGVTPLNNLAKIRIHADEKQFDIAVPLTDTGRALSFDIDVNSRGWFRFSAHAIDGDGNLSEASDTIVRFVGDPIGGSGETRERFDTLPRYWVQRGTWGLSNSFGHDSPGSYAETPIGQYPSSALDTVILYPYQIDIPAMEGYVAALSWFAAAFVDPLDTVFLDISYNGLDGPWEVASWWNASQESRWSDTTKGDDAWRFGYLEFQGGSFLLRLRFKSNLSRESDGFYIDDIDAYATLSDVADDSHSPIATAPYPNPAVSHAVFGLLQEREVQRVTLTDLTGNSVDASWQQHGRSVVVDVLALSAGVYTATLLSGVHTSTSLLRVMR